MQDQHKGNEQKLSIESAYFFKIMLENAQSTSIILLDKNGTILDINAGLQKSFGYTREDLIGKNFSLLFIDEDRAKRLPEKELDKAIKTGSATDNNYILHKNGSSIWV
ncbi:MAG TPA: PAS domain S-box protein, partial [Cytophagales bacterium]|nr:PAS domain S-box protein [Cytophagales bacterium]